MEKALGWSVQLVERPKKPAPEAVLKSWARELAKEGVLRWIGRNYCHQEASAGIASSVGSGADVFVDRPKQEDEQGL